MPASVGIEHTAVQRRVLLELARASIEYGVRYATPQPLVAEQADWLLVPAASFVTLTLRNVGTGTGSRPDEQGERLRGCIGSLQAYRSLAEDVNENAYAAAFRDPRFHPVVAAELALIRIELSVLSAPQLLPPVHSDSELLAQLVCGRDGVVLTQQGRRATFLPKVWAHFAEPVDFLRALRQKAGLAAEFDPAALYSVYQTETFAEC